MHTLLVYAILSCSLFPFLECNAPNQIVFTYGRIASLLLQGTWFFQVGFILFPLDGIEKWSYDMNDTIVLTQLFIWHLIFIMLFLYLQYWIIKTFFSSSTFISNRLNEDSNNDERNYFSLATDENFQFDVINIK